MSKIIIDGTEIDIIVQGFPGKSVCHGGLGWSTVVLLTGNGRVTLIDAGTFSMRKLVIAELDAAVTKLCEKIISFPKPATEGTKEYLRRAMGMTTPDAVDFARNIHAVINSSSEMRKKH